jgi:hypothetical protein
LGTVKGIVEAFYAEYRPYLVLLCSVLFARTGSLDVWVGYGTYTLFCLYMNFDSRIAINHNTPTSLSPLP